MAKRLAEKLSCGEVIILDGGLATELMTDGFKIEGDALWSARVLADSPEAIIPVHERFLDAGASIIETSSYQASIPLLIEDLGLSPVSSRRVISKSVQVALKARDRFSARTQTPPEEIVIAGSIGPYGCVLHDGSEYTGTYVETVSSQDIVEYHRNQAECLIGAGADILAFDTVPALAEGLCIVEAMDSLAQPTPYWISFSCKKTGEELTTSNGGSFSEAVDKLKGTSALAIGINCSDPELVTALLKSAPSTKPFVVYPNSGELWEQGKGWYPDPEKPPFSLVEHVNEWNRLGAQIIGGCCRVTPQDIHEIAVALGKVNSSS